MCVVNCICVYVCVDVCCMYISTDMGHPVPLSSSPSLQDIFSASGLDVVFFFDASTDVILQRAAMMEGPQQQLAKLDHIQQR